MGDGVDTSILRPLLADGQVPCPVERTLVTLDRCYACRYLVGAERRVDECTGEVVCDPPIGALVG
jgi:hypothetical protein